MIKLAKIAEDYKSLLQAEKDEFKRLIEIIKLIIKDEVHTSSYSEEEIMRAKIWLGDSGKQEQEFIVEFLEKMIKVDA